MKNLTLITFSGRSALKLNVLCLRNFPIKKDRQKAIDAKKKDAKRINEAETKEIKTDAFDVLPYLFLDHEPNEDSYRILGLKTIPNQDKEKKERVRKWILGQYIDIRYPKEEENNIYNFKVFIPKAIGSGDLGEALSDLEVGQPGDSSTPTFNSIGKFDTLDEVHNAIKYLKTKFARILLGVAKVTHDFTQKSVRYVPLQDFTNNSDIDWTGSIVEIDQQLYKKYKLSEEQINFIETTAQPMT